MAQALRRHIFTTCGHFRGRVESWDVVNEALAPDGTLADNVFLRKIGRGYIAQAFRWAREADPEALLLYNDNKVEGAAVPGASPPEAGLPTAPVADFYRKSDAMYSLLQELLADGVEVGGVGLQAHFNAAGVGLGRCPTPAAVAANVARLAALAPDFAVNISEMDVRISKLPPVPADSAASDAVLRSAVQAQIYGDVLARACCTAGFSGVTLWGFTDKHSWVHEFYHEDAPLVFDGEYRRKPSYFALLTALEAARARVGGGEVAAWGTGVGKDGLEREAGEGGAAGALWGSAWMQAEPTGEAREAAVAGSSLPDWQQQPA